MENLYKTEVQELTDLLRTEWTDIQQILVNQKLNIDKTYLLGFMETAENTEIGLFYTENKQLIRFEKTSNDTKLDVVTMEQIKQEFPQVAVMNSFEEL